MSILSNGKAIQETIPTATTFRASTPLELVHGDLCGPISPVTPGQKRYVFVLIDDHTRYMWTVLLKEKSEAFEKFKVFKTLTEQETQCTIKMFRTDRGGEFTSQEFQAYCDANGIKRHLTAPYSPQQNGVVERRNRTLMEMTRSILKHMHVPKVLWGEAVRHSTYLINRIATRSLKEQTPYEMLRSRKPNVQHLKVFGCVCYARSEAPGRKKLDDRTRMLVHLGTEPGSKAYRLLDPMTKRIIVSCDVFFSEEEEWNWSDIKETEFSSSGELVVELRQLTNGAGDGETAQEENDEDENPGDLDTEDHMVNEDD